LGANGAPIRLQLNGVAAADAWRLAIEDLQRAPVFEAIGPEAGFIADYVEHAVGGIVVADARCRPMRLRQRPGSPGALILLHAVVDGAPVFQCEHHGEVALKPGQLVIRSGRPGAIVRSDGAARVVTAAVARHLLAPRFVTPAALDDCNMVAAEGALPSRLLHGFIVGLAEPDGAMAQARDSAVDALGGLISAVLAQLPPRPEPLSELTSRRAADLTNYLRRNFANPALTPAVMAEELGISVRYAHKLMGLTGRSFRQELTALRLDAARAAFAANARPRQTIADIAISVGFNDLSQFNRHFRAAFGMTPRVARALDEAAGYAPRASEAA
jgi:AraC-like DNA-binding protein